MGAAFITSSNNSSFAPHFHVSLPFTFLQFVFTSFVLAAASFRLNIFFACLSRRLTFSSPTRNMIFNKILSCGFLGGGKRRDGETLPKKMWDACVMESRKLKINVLKPKINMETTYYVRHDKSHSISICPRSSLSIVCLSPFTLRQTFNLATELRWRNYSRNND